MSDSKLDELLRALEPFEGISKAEAEEELNRIAADFLAAIDAETLRPPQMREQLEALAEAAAHLRLRLERLSPPARWLLAFRLLPEDLEKLRGSVERDGANLPVPDASFEPSKPQESGWIPRLADLERLARGAATSKAIPEDRGGPRNPLLSHHPHPKAALAAEAWRLYERCRPEDASARRHGPLHSFAEDLLALAVRDRTDAKRIVLGGDTLYDHLREFKKARKALGAVGDELSSVLVALANCRRLGLDGRAFETQRRVLEGRLAELASKVG